MKKSVDQRCKAEDPAIEVNRIYNPIEVSGDSRDGMTITQTLLDALDEGYYNIPRESSLVDLAEKYGVSDRAVSERLRRATAQLIESSLVRDEELLVEEMKND